MANIVIAFMVVLGWTSALSAALTVDFYDGTCPGAIEEIKKVVVKAVELEPRMAASLVRLHFHDCFVMGCDASNLLDETPLMKTEKTTPPNNNSARGFELIDEIKAAVDKKCGRPIVSCADILAVAARDAIVAVGGPSWNIELGRRDSSIAHANVSSDLPGPAMDVEQLIKKFQVKNLSEQDLVVLSGVHTIGLARCLLFRNRIYNESDNLEPKFAQSKRRECPLVGGDDNLSPLEFSTPTLFDNRFYIGLLQKQGLLHSDAALLASNSTLDKVIEYANNQTKYFIDFPISMVKMGAIGVLTGENGVIRRNCRLV